MNQDKARTDRIITVGLLFGTQLFSFMIRFAFGVVAPTLMALYHISPKTMVTSCRDGTGRMRGACCSSVPSSTGSVLTSFLAWISALGNIDHRSAGLDCPVSLFLMRMAFGLAQTPLIPAGATTVSRGFSIQERTRIVAIAFAGNQMVLPWEPWWAHSSWRAWAGRLCVYCIGAASLLLTLAWFVLYPDKRIGRLPEKHAVQQISWSSLLRYRSTWGIAFGQMGYLYAYFFFVSWLPGTSFSSAR